MAEDRGNSYAQVVGVAPDDDEYYELTMSTFIDDAEDECGTAAARRRAALGDSVTGDRADTPPPPRDGIVDQLAVVVASSGVRASDTASFASAGTSCTTQTA